MQLPEHGRTKDEVMADLLAKRADDAARLKELLAAWERDVRPAR